eukprot:gene4781-6850_t
MPQGQKSGGGSRGSGSGSSSSSLLRSGQNKAHQDRRHARYTKKGSKPICLYAFVARTIAPKRNKAIQHLKTQRALEKSIKTSLENELASRCTEGTFHVIKVDKSKVAPTGKLLKQKVKQLSSSNRPQHKPPDKALVTAQEQAKRMLEQQTSDDEDVSGDDGLDDSSNKKQTIQNML